MIGFIRIHQSCINVLTLREIAMTILASFLGIITGILVDWNIPKLIDNQTIVSGILLTGMVGALIYGYKPRFEELFQAHEPFGSNIKGKSTWYPFRNTESKTKYHNHLVKDICRALEEQIRITSTSYTISLFNMPEEKRNVILSHFYTAENDSEKYRALYTTYRGLLEFERRMILTARKVYNFLEKIEGDLIDLHFKNYSDTQYTVNNLYSSLGILNKTDLINFYKIKDTFERLNVAYLPIDNFKEGEEYIVRIHNKDVFKSSSYEISNKCKLMLIKKLETFKELVGEAWIATNFESFARIEQYNTTIKNYFEFIINGEPITGSCIGCLQFFTGNQKSKFESLLGKFEVEKEDLAKI